jgi:cobalt-precorrin 5A hydrolase
MTIAILSVTTGGRRLAEKIAGVLGNEAVIPAGRATVKTLQEAWTSCEAMICVMSAGIVVRSVGPLCRDKYTDPCVIVLDEGGRHVISLLSGHLGGGNELARRVAAITGGEAVITTSSDTLGRTALDLWVAENRLLLRSDRKKMTMTAAKLVNTGSICLYSDEQCANLPTDFHRVAGPEQADIILTCRDNQLHDALYLSPRNLVIGIGCNRGTPAADIEAAVDETCRTHDLHRRSIFGCASIDAKINEPGLLQYAEKKGLPLHFFSKKQLNRVEGLQISPHAMAAVGAIGVAEPAAMLAAAYGATPGRLLIGKMKWKDVTTAVAAQNMVFKG